MEPLSFSHLDPSGAPSLGPTPTYTRLKTDFYRVIVNNEYLLSAQYLSSIFNAAIAGSFIKSLLHSNIMPEAVMLDGTFNKTLITELFAYKDTQSNADIAKAIVIALLIIPADFYLASRTQAGWRPSN